MIPVQKSAQTLPSLDESSRGATPSAERPNASAIRARPLGAPRRRNALRWGAIALVVLAMEFVYLFFISAGKYKGWPTYNLNYDMQAEGFRKGHLYLSVLPTPELLAKENPLDPANSDLWFADLSLYKGKYYNYWGPLPALAIAAYKSIFRVRSAIGDQYPVFILYSIYLVAGALIIDRMARRLFPSVPLYVVLLSIIAFALANPTPFLVATPGIYEAAIGGGQAFLLVGLVFAFDALTGKRSLLWARLLATGIAWAMAIACRVSVAPVAALIALFTAFMPLPHSGKRWVAVLRNLVLLGTPMAVGVFGLLWYNRARFDDWFEFGTNWMLNTVHIRASLEYVGANLYSYLLRSPVIDCKFPYFMAAWDMPQAFPSGFEIPEGYWVQEPVVGMLLAVPWVWLAPVTVWYGVRALLPRLGSAPELSRDAVDGTRIWCAYAFGVMATVAALPTLGVFGATMRYLGDVTAGFTLFCAWGACALYQHLRHWKWARRSAGAMMLVLTLGTVAMGLLLGYQGYNQHFQLYNTELNEHLTRAYSFCK